MLSGHEMDAWRYQLGGCGSMSTREAQLQQNRFPEQYQKLMYNLTPPPIIMTKEQFKEQYPFGLPNDAEKILLLVEEDEAAEI